MTIYSVFDPEFASYGRVITGYEAECKAVVEALNISTPLPEGTGYVPEEPALQDLPESAVLGASFFGGMPFQMGWCNGHNTKLNCLEYHRDSEFNLGTVPPDLEILEIGDLAEDRFRGIFKMCYSGDAFLTLKTRVQVRFAISLSQVVLPS